MATEAAVRAAIDALRARVNAARVEDGTVPDRTIVCHLSDLGVHLQTTLTGGKLTEVESVDASSPADGRLTAKSDDLIALLEGRLNVATAFLLGRIRIDASPSDMLLIRKLF